MTCRLLLGDSRERLPDVAIESIDALVCDPPYEYGFMGKKWDGTGIAFSADFWRQCYAVMKPGAHLIAFGATRTHHRIWCAIEDAGFEVRDTLQWMFSTGFPKGSPFPWQMHVIAASACGVMVECDHGCASESEHGMRFVRAAYLQAPVYACAECGQVLQPFVQEQGEEDFRAAWEKSKTCWPEQPCVEGRGDVEKGEGELSRCEVCTLSGGVFADGAEGRVHHGAPTRDGPPPWQVANPDGGRPSYRPQSVEQLDRQPDALCYERRAQALRGWNVALKPAYEPILLARKPLAGTVAATVLEHGTGGLNVDGCRVGTTDDLNGGAYSGNPEASQHTVSLPGLAGQYQQPAGRWPPNVLLTHAPDCGPTCANGCPVAELDRQSGESVSGQARHDRGTGGIWSESSGVPCGPQHGDSGGASRFFPTFRYIAKASRSEREAGTDGLPEKTGAEAVDREEGSAGVNNPRAGAGRTAAGVRNHHPTVKPIDLMRWLVRLVTPPSGTVLDPFMGSGSTGVAARLEGFGFIGIEMDPDYYAIARSRIEHFASERVEDDGQAPERPEKKQQTLF